MASKVALKCTADSARQLCSEPILQPSIGSLSVAGAEKPQELAPAKPKPDEKPSESRFKLPPVKESVVCSDLVANSSHGFAPVVADSDLSDYHAWDS